MYIYINSVPCMDGGSVRYTWAKSKDEPLAPFGVYACPYIGLKSNFSLGSEAPRARQKANPAS